MPEITLTVTVPETDGTDAQDLTELLREIRSLEHEHAANIDISDLKWTHSEWDWDSPCPYCGHERYHCEEFDYSYYTLGEEGFGFDKKADPGPEQRITAVMCANTRCNEQLYRGPASFVSE